MKGVTQLSTPGSETAERREAVAEAVRQAVAQAVARRAA
jgi:hypothetical protein